MWNTKLGFILSYILILKEVKIMCLQNKRYILRFVKISLYLILLLLWNYNNGLNAFATTTQMDSIKIILIDPGHGGIDGGAMSAKGTVEKHLNLNISLKVRDKLKELGYKVIMTREEDKGLYIESGNIYKMKKDDLINRCIMKINSNCDLFISIHQNFFKDSSCYGPQIWYSKNEKSSIFAHIIQRNFNYDLGYNKRIEKEADDDYKILRCYTNIPSVIVECGFLTNPKEEEKLKDEIYQDKIASSIVRSIKEYYDSNKD
jgi:N-acetylmuramoyl-L-alanine amidase